MSEDEIKAFEIDLTQEELIEKYDRQKDASRALGGQSDGPKT